MYTPSDFIRLFGNENHIIHAQTAGLSTPDTLIQPQPSGNCMNWVLGHTLESQADILVMLGGSSPVDLEALAIYRRDSDPIVAQAPGVWSLERLLAGHDAVHQALVECLGQLSDADFAREVAWGSRMATVGWRFLFLQFHFTYHIGQLELLRQLAGHTEKVI